MRDGRRRGLASAVARLLPCAFTVPDLHKLHTKEERPLVASAPGWCLWRLRLPLPDPADVVDAHAPGVEVEAHAHHVEARVLWEGDVRHDGGVHAHGGAARGDLTVTHPLDWTSSSVSSHPSVGTGRTQTVTGRSPSMQDSTSSHGVASTWEKPTCSSVSAATAMQSRA